MDSQNLGSLSRIDYEDTFTQSLSFKGDLRECLNQMFHHPPEWIMALLNLRNGVGKLFSLKSDGEHFNAHHLKNGDRWGFLQILEINEQTAVFRGDDKHLDFVVVLKIENQNLSCLTQVQYNNLWGRLYFAGVAPFHRQIVPALLKVAIGEIKN